MQRTVPLHTLSGKFFRNVSGMYGKDRFRNNRRERQRNVDKGQLDANDMGAAFTERSVYTNRHNPETMIKYSTAVDAVARRQTLNRSFDAAGGLDDAQMARIERDGGAETPGQRKMQRALDAEALGLGSRPTSGPASRPNYKKPREQRQRRDGEGDSSDAYASAGQGYTNQLHRVLTRETQYERKQRILTNNDMAPTEAEFTGILRRLALEDETSGAAEHAQERLVEEAGLYPSMRLDAFMLGDESAFPPWVHKLAPTVRDRVKYGGIGLTEDDEAMRVRLSSMPMDARRVEWARLKAARSYADGVKEQALEPREVHAVRLAKKRYFRLQAQRQHRATLIKRMALHKPDSVELLPSRHVDYSARLATIAQFVENGVDTKGQWPLDRGELQRAQIRNKQEEAERLFMRTADEKKLLKNSKFASRNIGAALESMDERVREYKRLSRKAYAHRVNNIVQGAEDDLGRRYKFVGREANNRSRALSNVSVDARRRLTAEPEPHARRFGPRKTRGGSGWGQQEGLGTHGSNPFNLAEGVNPRTIK